MSDKVCVAAIAGAFDVKGEVRLKSFCAVPEDVATYGPLATEDGARAFEVTLNRPIKNAYAAQLSGIRSKEQADALRGTRLYAARDALPDLPDDEFYHADLIGLEVYDPGGARLGEVRAVHDHGAGDLLEVFGPGLKSTVLVPFTREVVPTVDLTARRIVADPPAGLFPDATAEVEADNG